MSESRLETLVMSIGLFISLLIVLSIVSFKLIYWWLIIPLGMICTIVYFFLKYETYKKISLYEIGAIILTILFFGTMLYGVNQYNWLEDDDPYGYAITSSYITAQHTFIKPIETYLTTYATPHPVGYSVIMSLFQQPLGHIAGVLKIMNVLFISLALLFGFYMFNAYFNDHKKAFYAFFVLFCLRVIWGEMVFIYEF